MFPFLRSGRNKALTLAAACLLTTFGCESPREVNTPAPDGAARLAGPLTFWALTDGNQLLQIRSDNPSAAMMTVNVTGLMSGDRLMAIDFRPATGQLYGVSSQSRVYMINPMTGVARMVGSGPVSPTINGDAVGLDFNPTVDRLRLITNAGQNLRLNPETGAVQAVDGAINGAPNASLSGTAYTNNFAGATSTTQYTIDPVSDKLFIQNPPNNGTQIEVGGLGVDIVGTSGFDISPTGEAIAALGRTGSVSELYEINLSSGQATKLGDFPGQSIIGLAIPTSPVAYAVDGLNRLMTFNPLSPGTPIMRMLTGLQMGEMLVGIDFRPANGQLYGISNMSRMYTINTANGAATAVGGAFSPMLMSADVGMDFNPTVDRIRVVTATGQNLRLNPDTGALVAVDGNLNPGMPNVTATAYTNNFAGATTTTMINIDSNTDRLVRQDPPNAGGQVDIGPLGLNVEGANGFDIGGTSNVGYALLRQGVMSGVYRIDLSTGAATSVATFPMPIQAMAVGLGF
ncbi:MAG: DUF4394 domain-containing protein [Cytophagales bacterium]|nr:MAG: DUF4394 domain-containing protein [Cytophagales bacterium]